MTIFITLLLALALLLAPLISGVPDEPIWSSWLAAAVGLAGALAVLAGSKSPPKVSADAAPIWRGPAGVFALLVVWALLSAGWALLHPPLFAFAGLMARGWATLAMQFALFLLARHAARRGRSAAWVLILGLVAGAAIVAAIGANEYARHWRLGEPGWRVFATSTPDFLAGYLVMLLPLTLAVFLAVRAGALVFMLIGLVSALELGVMLATGSRFALVSLLVGLGTSGTALAWAVRRGLRLEPEVRRRLLGLGVVFAAAALLAAKPVLARLLTTHAGDNSAAFRVWTWRGAARMAWANPIFGTGIGAWAQTYPRYALTGFTRLAHSGYLQMADECGLVGLALMLALLVAVVIAAARGLSRAPVPPPDPPGRSRRGRASAPAAKPPVRDEGSSLLPADSRWLLCGLLGGLAAAMTQNLIDSDWSVFFIGLCFWAMAGFAVGLAEGEGVSAFGPAVSPTLRVLAGFGASLLLAYFACQGTAALWGAAARAAPSPLEAEADYSLASAWDPLNAAYPAELGYRVYGLQNNLPAAGMMLRRAVRLRPDGVNYRRLGTVLLAEGRRDEAEGAWERGLTAEPHSLDLLLALASITPPPSNMGYYRTIARLELSPVGTVRAIGGITEAKFAIANAALGDAAVSPTEVQEFYTRAAQTLQAYADEGGSVNPQRQAMQGGQTDPAQDAQMRALYVHVMDRLRTLVPPSQRSTLTQKRQATLAQFNTLLPKP